MDRRNIKNIYPLTPLQEGMLFHALREPNSTTYFEQLLLRIGGEVDLDLFAAAWQELVRRHDILRTLFVHEKVPEPLQIVLKERPCEIERIDLRRLPAAEQEARIAAEHDADRARLFRLDRDPLLRIRIFRRGETSCDVLWSFHHILLDGWSTGILRDELLTIYAARRRGNVPRLPEPPPFSRYVKYLRTRDREGSLRYWVELLSGCHRLLPLPGRRERAQGEPFRPAYVDFALTPDLTAAALAFARNRRTTLNTVIQAVWGTLLGRGRPMGGAPADVVFLSTVSGRPPDLPEVERMVGLFINAVPVRAPVAAGMTFASLLDHLHRQSVEGQPHHFSSLADIQARTALKHNPADHILVFENHTPDDSPLQNGCGFAIEAIEALDHSNFALTLQVHPGERLGFHLIFDASVLARGVVETFGRQIREILEKAVSDPDSPVDSPVFDTAGLLAPPPTNAVRLVIAATFTAEPLEPHLLAWAERAALPLAPAFAPYNQIFRELLDPGSETSRNDGANLLLLRFEDRLRDLDPADRDGALAALEEDFSRLLAGVRHRTGQGLLLVGLLPPSPPGTFPAAIENRLRELEGRLREALPPRGSVRLLDLTDLPRLFALEPIHDSEADRAAHVPYHEAFYGAVACTVVRTLHAWRTPGFKVIAVDGDNTLWRGVCGEDGPEGVRVDGGHAALQRFLLRKYEEGFLLVLCSKNNAADVQEVFLRNEGMLLRPDHFVASRINWGRKSANLREMADELRLGSSSFVFIDDAGAECSEVMRNAPEILTLRPPEDPTAISRWLETCWAFDRFTITGEDRERSGMYRAEHDRNETLARVGLDDFLKDLELRVAMVRLRTEDLFRYPEGLLDRLSQLTLRTNQFNLNGCRRTREELAALLADEGTPLWGIEVADRFGRYGIVGLICGRVRGETLTIDAFLLSCRVLGREVECALLAGLGRFCREEGVLEIVLMHRETERNRPCREFLLRAGGSFAPPDDAGTICWRIGLAALPALPAHIKLLCDAAFLPPPAAPPRPIPPFSALDGAGVEPRQDSGWTVELVNEENLLHRTHYAPLRHCTAETLAAPGRSRGRRKWSAPAVAPRTPLEETVAALWCDLLSLPEVGVEDNFFELGGHSLTATRLVSRLHGRLGATLSLAEVFSHPTVAAQTALLAERTAAPPPETPVAPEMEHYPLAHMQRRLWLLQQIAPASPFYSTPGCHVIDGPLNPVLLRRAFAAVTRRHEPLRAVFLEIGGEPRQRFLPDLPADFRCHDLREESDPEATARRLAQEEIARPFDLAAGPPCRTLLMRTAEERHILVWNVHHIVSDGWSMRILADEVFALYRGWSEGGDPELPALIRRYRDFAWQQQTGGNRASGDRRYWLEKLSGDIPVLDLPSDRPRPPTPSWRGATLSLPLPATSVASLRQMAIQADAGLFPPLVALVKILLMRITGETDIVVGTPVSGRHLPGLEPLVGLFVNTVPLRDAVRPEAPFREVVRAVRQSVAEALAHQEYPFDRLVEELGLKREMSRSALFDVMVVLHDERETAETGGLCISPLSGVDAGTSRFDLTFSFLDLGEELRLELIWALDLFDERRIRCLLEVFETLCRHAAADPEVPAGSLDLLTLEARRRLLQRFATPRRGPLPEKTLVDLFADRVREDPDRAALIHAGGELTRRQLLSQAEEVAARLAGEASLCPEEAVAVMARRSPGMIAALLGILRARGAYLPIDPVLPAQRVRHMLEQSRCRLLLLEEGLRRPDGLPDGVSILPLAAAPRCVPPHIAPPGPSSLAYILFTSGSTGRPKGVMIEHGGFVNMILDQIALFEVTAEDRVLQFASLSFDASLSEIFMALLAGAPLVLPHEEEIRDPERFGRLMKRAGVTVVTLPPSYLNALDEEVLSKVRTLVTAGEPAIPADAWRYGRRLRYFNAYGPTETSVCATVHRFVPQGEAPPPVVPIGAPMRNLSVHLLDERLHPVPVGFSGEICIGGPGVARGYVNAPDLTAERFVPDPFGTGARLYRTGDLGERLENGDIVFRGRRDEQVKIRGYRIEPGEIARVLEARPDVRRAVVLPVHAGESTRLAAFVVQAAPLDPAALRDALRQTLPEYMLPAVFVPVPGLPTTVNGKIDKTTLLQLLSQQGKDEGAYEPPTGWREELLAQLWGEILGRERVGRHDGFFDLGGDSIRAMRAVSALRRHGLALGVRDLFLHPTVAGLAPLLREERGGREEDAGGSVPLSPAQAWYFDRFVPHSCRVGRFDPTPNAVLLHLKTAISDAGISALFVALLRRHPMLRATFRWGAAGEERIVQEIPDGPAALAPEIVDLRRVTDAARAMAERCRSVLQALHPFAPPPLRALLFRRRDGDRLLIAIHHLVVDGVSWRILLDDAAQGMRHLATGREIALPPATDSFRNWTAQARALAAAASLRADLPRWKEVLARGRCRMREPSPLAERRRLENVLSLPGDLSPERLLTALYPALRSLTGETRIPLMLEGHGRDAELFHGDFDGTVGWFTAFYPAVLSQTGAAAPARTAGYGILRHLAAAGKELASGEPTIGFNWLGDFETAAWRDVFAVEPVTFDPAALPDGRMTRELQITASRVGETLHVLWEYDAGRFDGKDIATAAQEFLLRLYPRREQENNLPQPLPGVESRP